MGPKQEYVISRKPQAYEECGEHGGLPNARAEEREDGKGLNEKVF